MKYLSLLLIVSAFFSNTSSVLAADATELKIKLYKFAVSTSDDCSSLTTVIDNGDTASEVNLVSDSGPVNLGSGNIPMGTYPCVAIEMSDHIKFKTAHSGAGCSQGSDYEYSNDICPANAAANMTFIDGTPVTCSNSEEKIVLLLTTGARPESWYFPLGNALSVTDTTVGKFIVPRENIIDENNSNTKCSTRAPDFSFSKIN